jgi:hypothetical protein
MDYADLAPLLSDARVDLARRGIRPTGEHWQACITDDLVDLVQAGRSDEAARLLTTRLLAGADCACPEGACGLWEVPASPSEAKRDGDGPLGTRQRTLE